MEEIFDEIQGALDAGFPYAAIMLALALPDVCASLALPSEAKEKSGVTSRYIKWYNDNVADHLQFLTAEDCFSLRCGVVHSGVMGNKDRKFERAFFMVNSPVKNIEMTDNSINGVTYGRTVGLDTSFFIATMIEAARKWYETAKDTPNVQKNSSRLVRRHPDGLPPLMGGVQCIA